MASAADRARTDAKRSKPCWVSGSSTSTTGDPETGASESALGFEEAAKLDDGDLWVTSFALPALTPDTGFRTPDTEKTTAEHIRRAASRPDLGPGSRPVRLTR